jgi:hypothetical protein
MRSKKNKIIFNFTENENMKLRVSVPYSHAADRREGTRVPLNFAKINTIPKLLQISKKQPLAVRCRTGLSIFKGPHKYEPL